jgi:hypothetical protein
MPWGQNAAKAKRDLNAKVKRRRTWLRSECVRENAFYARDAIKFAREIVLGENTRGQRRAPPVPVAKGVLSDDAVGSIQMVPSPAKVLLELFGWKQLFRAFGEQQRLCLRFVVSWDRREVGGRFREADSARQEEF